MAITPLMPVYPRCEVRPVRGEGVYLYGEQGEKYLDFASGIAVNLLGHGHPHLTKAIQKQAATLIHVSNLYGSPQGEAFAQRLVDLTFADTVFFTNSGVEAVECAIKTARRYHHAKGNAAQARPDHLHERLPRADDGDDQRDRSAEDDRRLRPAASRLQGRRVRQPRRGAGGGRREYRRLPARAGAGRGRHPPGKPRVHRRPSRSVRREGPDAGVRRSAVRRCSHRHLCSPTSNMASTPDIMASAKGIGGGFPLGACLATEKAARGHGHRHARIDLWRQPAGDGGRPGRVRHHRQRGIPRQRPRKWASGCARRSSR